ncbi:MFS transporter [Roseospirillum parvum]|uniref:Siderophore transporter, RhtX/FptX family n=1 Tax=Roseospirillum parvum TaxID=83401 RepID=A0A1G8C735_9PROT|nr:MFS transporter [Roseospirillum parvum]SDH40730.1 siderophore transporter, RhtX/FptX family [Roseospirillum parvum]
MRPANPERTLLTVIGALYLAQGISFGLVVEALPALLRAGGVPLELIALVPMAMLPWMVKVVWAPLVDNRGGRRLGRRRGWILPTQGLLVAALLGVAAVPFDADGAVAIIALLGVACLAACTQDIATDGLAAERLGRPRMALANTLQVGGMMAGMLVGGAGMMVLADLIGVSGALSAMAGLIALTAIPVLLWREPPPVARQTPTKARLRGFFRNRRGWALAVVALVFANGHSVSSGLSRLLLIDLDWSLARVGVVVGSGNALAIILGAGLAGSAVRAWGAVPASVVGLLVLLLAQTLWLVAADAAPLPLWLAMTATLGGGIGSGMVSVAVFTLAFRFAHDGGQAGTDMTMVQCLHGLGGMVMTAAATALVARTGFVWGFGLGVGCSLLALAAILLTRRLCEPERFPTPAPTNQEANQEANQEECPAQ